MMDDQLRLRTGDLALHRWFVLFVRFVALVCLAGGVYYWLRLIGFYPGLLWRFDLMPWQWQTICVSFCCSAARCRDRIMDQGVMGRCVVGGNSCCASPHLHGFCTLFRIFSGNCRAEYYFPADIYRAAYRPVYARKARNCDAGSVKPAGFEAAISLFTSC